MTRRFPTLLTHLALTLTLASSCTPGMLNLVPGASGTLVSSGDQPVMPTDAALAQNVSVGEAKPIAGVATLKASPIVKASVTEMTQTLQELLAFETDSTAVGDSFTVEGFAVMAKPDDTPKGGKGNAAKGPVAPVSSPPCGAAPASDVPVTPTSDTGATASDVTPAPSAMPTCPPVGNEKTKTTVTNPDGSRTRTMTRTRALPGGGSMTESMTRTQGKSPKFMAFKHVRDMVLPNGSKRHQEREQTMNADGSGTVTVTMSFTRADGKTRSLTMTTTITADGTKTRTGTLTRFDGTTVTLAGKGTQVTLTDPATDTTVTTGETPTGTTGPVDVTVGGTPAGTVDPTTPTDAASPTPSASASDAPTAPQASPTAAPVAEASPSAEPSASSSPAAVV